MQRISTGLMVGLISAMHCFSVYADLITGEITFVSSVPFAGILYSQEHTNNPASAKVDQKDREFTTKLLPIAQSGKVIFFNSDDVVHNVFINDAKTNVQFDAGLMRPGGEIELDVNWQGDSLVRIGCKIHPKMRTYIANISSEHFQLLAFEKKTKVYAIEIENVPSQVKELVLLMPKYQPVHITISKDETFTIDLLKRDKVKGRLTLARQ